MTDALRVNRASKRRPPIELLGLKKPVLLTFNRRARRGELADGVTMKPKEMIS